VDDVTAWNEIIRRMVHDLRTPLNTIVGFASLVRDGQAGPITEQQREFLDYVLSGARELEAIMATATRESEKRAHGAGEHEGEPRS